MKFLGVILSILILSCSNNKIIEINYDNFMVNVQGGTFSMGDYSWEIIQENYENIKLPHPVILSDFEISKYEITQQEYLEFANETNSNYPCWMETGNLYNLNTGISNDYKKVVGSSKDECPIVGVSWYNAVSYCNWRSQKENLEPCYQITDSEVKCNWDSNGYRLPTEAEWEYAARGGLLSKNYQYSGNNK